MAYHRHHRAASASAWQIHIKHQNHGISSWRWRRRHISIAWRRISNKHHGVIENKTSKINRHRHQHQAAYQWHQ